MKVRIVEPALSGYTGMLYQISFTDGVSNRELTDQEVSMIGAAMRVENLDGDQVGAAVDHMRRYDVTLDKAVQKNAETVEAIHEAAEEEAPAAKDKPSFTREELEAIADAEGIAGLRAVADPLGIKGRSINELIGEILDYVGS